jgi:SAM-dependent methyltransferase
MREVMRTRESSAGVWDAEWRRAWKAHPENVWFDYEADVYLARLGAPDAGRALRVLKTDAFDEACGRRRLTDGVGGDVVLVDVALSVVRQAVRAGSTGVVACAADVRALPFSSGTFDVVLSTSTLDHFDSTGEIDVALAELRRVLRDDGRLFVTLDNPSNPILRVRQLVYRVTGAIAGLIPFRMGLTLSRDALVDAAAGAGFEVCTSGYVVHAPRLFALWAGECAARRGSVATARRLGAAFRSIERVVERWATRRWTAHFIFAECRPRAATATDLAPPARRPPLPHWLLKWKETEMRLRSAYLRTVPPAVLATVDPPLRRVAAGVRRVAAVPVYLRQPLTRWTGACDGTSGRVVVWSAREARSILLDVLLEQAPAAEAIGESTMPPIVEAAASGASDADVLIAHTTPALAPRFRRAGFHIVPGMVRFGGDPDVLLANIAAWPSALVGDLRRLERADYRVEVWSHTPERSRLFYDRYLVPHSRVRFRERAEVPAFDYIDRLFAAGALVAVVRPASAEPDALGLVVERADVLWTVLLGTRDADPVLLRAGALAGVYRAQIELARARGLRRIDFGRVRPWASDGVYQYKWKWGARPIPDGTQTLEFAVKVLRPESPVAERLVAHGVVVREGRRYRTFTRADLSVR